MTSGHSRGTGLGLTITQTIVHRHEGQVECESIPGRTSFRLLLPFEAGSTTGERGRQRSRED